MSYQRSIHAYQKQAVAGASPLQLIIMLYDAAIRNLEMSKKLIDDKNYYEKNNKLIKARDIITELTGCLDMEKGQDIAANLASIYHFIFRSIIEANINDDKKIIDDCIGLLRQLKEAWVEVEQESRLTQTAAQASAV